MEKYIGQEIEDLRERERFLEDNCDAVEVKGYMKLFTPEELQSQKEELVKILIKIAEVEAEAKQAAAEYKGTLKPLRETRARIVSDVKAKAKYVNEPCYRFTDQETHVTGYYSKTGDLIETRPAAADELQVTIFQAVRAAGTKTGTDN